MKHAKLISIDLPEFGDPVFEPIIPAAVYAARSGRLLKRMAAGNLDTPGDGDGLTSPRRDSQEIVRTRPIDHR